MSRYQEFDCGEEEAEAEELEWGEPEPVCVKGLLPKPNPLMHRVEFVPLPPNAHYPAPAAPLPDPLSVHHYHADRNNMALIEESAFAHYQLQKDVARCLQPHTPQDCSALQTLHEFYNSRSLVYEKFTPHSSYFATYVLSLAQLARPQPQGQVSRAATSGPTSQRARVQFSSDFEGGNLFRVYQREAQEYDLILQNDINTRGNNQWFFFSVRNVPRGHTLRLNIVNMAKRHSLFALGMRPSVFSLTRWERRGVGWVREGARVSYQPSCELRKEASAQPYHTLSFDYKFEHEGDIVYFSYAMPYTLSDLNRYLSSRLAHHAGRVRVKPLANTVGNNEVNVFHISSPRVTAHRKPAVWVLARQHPGETTSSFMLEGIMDFLLSGSLQAEELLEEFVFKVVAMVNVDGVVHGNTRAELVGCDPNRQWVDPHPHHHPVLHALRRLVLKDDVRLLLDLHSHSRRTGTFFYANHAPPNSLTRVFPLLVANDDLRFDWRGNRFGGGSNLSARKVLGDLLQAPLVYTVESSFYGYQREGDFKITPYQPEDYRQMGASILTAFASLTHKTRHAHLDDHRLLLGQQQQDEEDGLWKRASANDDAESVGSDEDPGADEFTKKELELVIPRKKPAKHKKRRLSVKLPETRPRRDSKPDLPEPPKRLPDPEPCIRKIVAARCSLSLKRTELRFARKATVETKNAGVQADAGERGVLGRSSVGNVVGAARSGLCVWGQKVEEEVTVSGCSVGVQVEMARAFLRNRGDMAASTENLSRRAPKKTARVGTIVLHNENNFLNRGDILHSALRMLNKR